MDMYITQIYLQFSHKKYGTRNILGLTMGGGRVKAGYTRIKYGMIHTALHRQHPQPGRHLSECGTPTGLP
jgi:hypothetical protein